ncbi:hypothetical protein ACRRTK_022501 [Alexandromys fortis]
MPLRQAKSHPQPPLLLETKPTPSFLKMFTIPSFFHEELGMQRHSQEAFLGGVLGGCGPQTLNLL